MLLISITCMLGDTLSLGRMMAQDCDFSKLEVEDVVEKILKEDRFEWRHEK